MTQKTMISIWFWVGLVLGVYGVMMVGAGIYYVFVPEAAQASFSLTSGEPVSDEALAEQQRQRAADATRAEAVLRNANAAERLATSTLQLRQAVNNPALQARLDLVASNLKSIGAELSDEATHLTRPQEEMKIMVGKVGGNPALWWGLIMLAFGVIFLFLGRRSIPIEG